LDPTTIIARFEYLKKSARNFGSVLIGIETSDAANFERIEAEMTAGGFEHRDITNDQILAEFLI
jgi:threonine dehydratase